MYVLHTIFAIKIFHLQINADNHIIFVTCVFHNWKLWKQERNLPRKYSTYLRVFDAQCFKYIKSLCIYIKFNNN